MLLKHTVMNVPQMRNYPEAERISAERLVQINDLLFQEKTNWDNILVELENIFSKIPLSYNNSFVEDGITYIKLWDSEEFTSYLELKRPQNKIYWLLNAFPKCCYLLSIIYIERGEFEKALKTLLKGIELEPDNPRLLNEMGLLLTQIGQSSKDKDFFYQSIKYYENAFDSRPFNTNAQKARSLRGIGFNLMELNDYESAKKLYEASLTWEESSNARNEIRIIEEKTANPNSIVLPGLSNFNDADSGYSYEFFYEQQNKLPLNVRERIPNKYAYIWSKAAMLRAKGAANFRKDDFFHYPLEEWNSEQIESGTTQIVQYLKGVTSEHYIALNTLEDVKNLLMTFHFSLLKHTTFVNSNGEILIRGEFKHIVDDGEIILFFKIEQ
jgi:tetratricopeptide (TPR) repeat protein